MVKLYYRTKALLLCLRREDNMSAKRRDKKNRVLRNGESQRADGRYAYKYVDVDGKAKFVYSWKLVETDKLPYGKRDCISLREKEKEIQKQLEMKVSYDFSNKKLVDTFEYYINGKANIKDSTRQVYTCLLNLLKNDSFGQYPIGKITTEKAKKWIVFLNETRGFNRVKSIKSVLSSMFRFYIEDDKLVKNPFDFDIGKLLKNDVKARECLTEFEEKEFRNYLRNSRYAEYYEAFNLLLLTGLRISELCGLTLSDIDFANRTITIDKQLLYVRNKKCIQSTKSEKGTRMIPITSDIEECLRNIIATRRDYGTPYTLDGVTDFLFLTNRNTATEGKAWNAKLSNIVRDYNATHTTKLRKITPHILRHTYCSRQIQAGMPIKILQYLMGHSSVNLTLDVYAHTSYNDVIKSVLGD